MVRTKKNSTLNDGIITSQQNTQGLKAISNLALNNAMNQRTVPRDDTSTAQNNDNGATFTNMIANLTQYLRAPGTKNIDYILNQLGNIRTYYNTMMRNNVDLEMSGAQQIQALIQIFNEPALAEVKAALESMLGNIDMTTRDSAEKANIAQTIKKTPLAIEEERKKADSERQQLEYQKNIQDQNERLITVNKGVRDEMIKVRRMFRSDPRQAEEVPDDPRAAKAELYGAYTNQGIEATPTPQKTNRNLFGIPGDGDNEVPITQPTVQNVTPEQQIDFVLNQLKPETPLQVVIDSIDEKDNKLIAAMTPDAKERLVSMINQELQSSPEATVSTLDAIKGYFGWNKKTAAQSKPSVDDIDSDTDGFVSAEEVTPQKPIDTLRLIQSNSQSINKLTAETKKARTFEELESIANERDRIADTMKNLQMDFLSPVQKESAEKLIKQNQLLNDALVNKRTILESDEAVSNIRRQRDVKNSSARAFRDEVTFEKAQKYVSQVANDDKAIEEKRELLERALKTPIKAGEKTKTEALLRNELRSLVTSAEKQAIDNGAEAKGKLKDILTEEDALNRILRSELDTEVRNESKVIESLSALKGKKLKDFLDKDETIAGVTDDELSSFNPIVIESTSSRIATGKRQSGAFATEYPITEIKKALGSQLILDKMGDYIGKNKKYANATKFKEEAGKEIQQLLLAHNTATPEERKKIENRLLRDFLIVPYDGKGASLQGSGGAIQNPFALYLGQLEGAGSDDEKDQQNKDLLKNFHLGQLQMMKDLSKAVNRMELTQQQQSAIMAQNAAIQSMRLSDRTTWTEMREWYEVVRRDVMTVSALLGISVTFGPQAAAVVAILDRYQHLFIPPAVATLNGASRVINTIVNWFSNRAQRNLINSQAEDIRDTISNRRALREQNRTEREVVVNNNNNDDSDPDPDSTPATIAKKLVLTTPKPKGKKGSKRQRKQQEEEEEIGGDFGNFHAQTGINRSSSKVLDEYGKDQITNIRVMRKKVPGFVNVLYTKILPYDKLYHLFAIVTVNHNGESKDLIVEKQSYINISTSFSIAGDTEIYNVPGPYSLDLDQIMKNLRVIMGTRMYSYDAFKNNCQVFISYFLGVMNKWNEQVKKFVLQDKIQEAKVNPLVRGFTNAVTDLHGLIKSSLFGGNEN